MKHKELIELLAESVENWPAHGGCDLFPILHRNSRVNFDTASQLSKAEKLDGGGPAVVYSAVSGKDVETCQGYIGLALGKADYYKDLCFKIRRDSLAKRLRSLLEGSLEIGKPLTL